MDEDFCVVCGGSDCKSCSEDPYSAPCGFCGDVDCDGTGYNCLDDFYDTYNEGEANYLARG